MNTDKAFKQSALLRWENVSSVGEIKFSLSDALQHLVPVKDWGRHPITTSLGAGNVGHLLGLLDDGAVSCDEDFVVRVRYEVISYFSAYQLACLGLPAPAPYTLRLDGSKAMLASPGFTFRYFWVSRSSRRPDLDVRRDGVFLIRGNACYVLQEPFYQIIDKIDCFNALRPDDIDGRFLVWSELKDLLPEDAVIDNHLAGMNIMRAEAFTLDYSSDGQLHPVLLTHNRHTHAPLVEDGESPQEETAEHGSSPLPPAARQQFNMDFLNRDVQPRYAMTAGNWFVVVPPMLKKALGVVKKYQNSAPYARLSFLHNPVGSLKDELAGEMSEEQLEAMFEEHPLFASTRVLGLGEWVPKTGVYVQKPETQWVPPEDYILNIPVSDGVVSIQIKELLQVHEAMGNALDEGKASIDVNGRTMPVSRDAFGTIDAIIRKAESGIPGMPDAPVQGVGAKQLVPLIIDNIETEGYTGGVTRLQGESRVPAMLASSMYPHQQDGLKWMQDHWNARRPFESGALLADDMGLGKTLQSLAFIAWLYELQEAGRFKPAPFLVVAPTGLLANWKKEAACHLKSPGLGDPVEAFGSSLKALMSATMHDRVSELESAVWVLTTYETLRDRIQLFMGISWRAVVFDEVQKIKTPTSRMTEMAKSLNADFLLAMTGTPIENSLADLWSILDTTNPGLLGAYRDFRSRYESPSSDEQNGKLLLREKIMDESATDARVPLPYMLRRLKDDHLKGLPEKRVMVIEERMPDIQAAKYSEVVASVTAGKNIKMIEALLSMRRISMLSVPIETEGLTQRDIDGSARLKAMIRILDEIHRKGEKALIFVEYLNLQDALIPFLQARYAMEHPPYKISGEINGGRRQDIVDDFQGRPSGVFDVLILSPKAGGVGLTLTAANHVIHLTRWWNPAVEDQCTDRAYRIGQEKPVTVYLPMAIHPQAGDYSFDRNLNAMLDRKRLLSRTVLEPAAASAHDLEELYEKSFAGWA